MEGKIDESLNLSDSSSFIATIYVLVRSLSTARIDPTSIYYHLEPPPPPTLQPNTAEPPAIVLSMHMFYLHATIAHAVVFVASGYFLNSIK